MRYGALSYPPHCSCAFGVLVNAPLSACLPACLQDFKKHCEAAELMLRALPSLYDEVISVVDLIFRLVCARVRDAASCRRPACARPCACSRWNAWSHASTWRPSCKDAQGKATPSLCAFSVALCRWCTLRILEANTASLVKVLDLLKGIFDAMAEHGYRWAG